MTTIKIKQHGDVVYFLNSGGFQKGSIKRTVVVSEKHSPISIKYFVVSESDNEEYGGSERAPSDLFDSAKEMITHFQKKFNVSKQP